MTTRAPEQEPEESGHGVRIARLGGVPIYLAPSWFLIAVVIVAIVGPPLARARPDLGVWAYGVGVVQALLLLASVLVHEGAHAVAARSVGMPVVRIVANLWGGHTSMESARATPGRLALIAAAGPAANAVVAGLAWLALPAVSADLPGRLLEGVVIINGSLAVLNILPGMPLDGGQVLESLVWKVTGNRNRGSVVAGWAGRVLAVLVVLVFFVRPLVAGEQIGFSQIWTVLIATILWGGATQSIQRGRSLASIDRVRVGDVSERAVYLSPDTPLGVAIAHPDVVVTSDSRNVPCLLLNEPEGALGADLDPNAPLVAAVTRIPDENVVEAAPDAGIEPVLVAMQSSRVGIVVLTQHGRPYAVTFARLVNEVLARN